MKILALFCFLLMVNLAFSQVAVYGEITSEKKFIQYVTKIGDTLNIGDEITIGLPSTDQGFRFITQGNAKTADWLSGNNVIIHKMKSWSGDKRNYKIYLHIKGYGMVPVLIDYENALLSNEILEID